MYSMSNRNSEELKKPQKRLEYIEKNVGVYRTGGAAVTKTFKKDGVGATLKKLPSLNDKKAKDKVKGFD